MNRLATVEIKKEEEALINIEIINPSNWNCLEEFTFDDPNFGDSKKRLNKAEEIVEKFLVNNGLDIYNVDIKSNNTYLPPDVGDEFNIGRNQDVPPGFPDLICVDGQDKFLVEVKMSTDGLNKNQLKFWRNNNFEFYIAYVDIETNIKNVYYECQNCLQVLDDESEFDSHTCINFKCKNCALDFEHYRSFRNHECNKEDILKNDAIDVLNN